MIEAALSPLVVEACSDERKEVLISWNAIVAKCEKGLTDYLE